MNEAKIGLDPTENEMLFDEVSDEVIEAAACLGPENVRVLTIAMCTGGLECPY